MKKNKTMIICFILPCLLTLFIMYLYPVARTLIMSFFRIESVTSDVSTWSFYGLAIIPEYSAAPHTGFPCGTCSVSGWSAVFLHCHFHCSLPLSSQAASVLKNFFRAAIYLPNVISAVALATMWIQYVYNNDYGMLNKILGALGLKRREMAGNRYEVLGHAVCLHFQRSRFITC